MNNANRSSRKTQKLLADIGAQYLAAQTIEVTNKYHDTFTRLYSKVSVELCHGEWCTFSRLGGIEGFRRHSDRESARQYARTLLG
jgi:hypothetical protein